jgi:CelD/BcsL family acetyltransferase involved in cellulose biosynthesis
VQYAQRLWLLKIGYDPAFARCSPGLLLMAATLRHAIERGLRSYELLGVDEPWLRPWNPSLRACVTVRIHPAGPLGRLAHLAYQLMP